MVAQKGDVSSVAYGLRELLRKLEGLSYSTFPGSDKEQQRFLAVVRTWANVPWTEMTWDPAARKMQEMLPSLREVCALKCANLHYTKSIHRIRALVEGICAWQADAVEEAATAQKAKAQKAVEAAAEKAARAQAEAETKAARRARVVEARASVTRETRRWGGRDGYTRQTPVMLTAEQSEAVRAVVEAMEKNVFALESLVTDLSREKLWYIKKAVAYLDSCSGDGTWIWNAEEWAAASEELTWARDTWSKLADENKAAAGFTALAAACDACIRDMQQYKALCDATQDGIAWYKRMLGLKANLDALKELNG